MGTKIEVKVLPHIEYKGKVITKIGGWYKVSGSKVAHKSLQAATDSI